MGLLNIEWYVSYCLSWQFQHQVNCHSSIFRFPRRTLVVWLPFAFFGHNSCNLPTQPKHFLYQITWTPTWIKLVKLKKEVWLYFGTEKQTCCPEWCENSKDCRFNCFYCRWTENSVKVTKLIFIPTASRNFSHLRRGIRIFTLPNFFVRSCIVSAYCQLPFPLVLPEDKLCQHRRLLKLLLRTRNKVRAWLSTDEKAFTYNKDSYGSNTLTATRVMLRLLCYFENSLPALFTRASFSSLSQVTRKKPPKRPHFFKIHLSVFCKLFLFFFCFLFSLMPAICTTHFTIVCWRGVTITIILIIRGPR